MQVVPAGGLVLLRRLHLQSSWSPDVPCYLYIRVPRPPSALLPRWPLNVEEARRLQEAAKEELVRLGRCMQPAGGVEFRKGIPVLVRLRFHIMTISSHRA